MRRVSAAKVLLVSRTSGESGGMGVRRTPILALCRGWCRQGRTLLGWSGIRRQWGCCSFSESFPAVLRQSGTRTRMCRRMMRACAGRRHARFGDTNSRVFFATVSMPNIIRWHMAALPPLPGAMLASFASTPPHGIVLRKMPSDDCSHRPA